MVRTGPPEDFDVELGRSIRFHRQARDMSVTELARLVETRDATIRRMELGHWTVSTRVLIRIGAALGMTLDEIVPFKARDIALTGPMSPRAETSRKSWQDRSAAANAPAEVMPGVEAAAAKLAQRIRTKG